MKEGMRVGAASRLLDFLRKQLPDWKRKTLEERLRAGCVRVNGATVWRNDEVAVGDVVHIVAFGAGESAPPEPKGLAVLYSDDELVAVDKPAGMLSVATERQRERTALALVRDALSRPGKPARLWPVHRLDRETSGVLLFARTREACDAVQATWNETRKVYLAVVEGRPEPASGVVEQPLWEDPKSLAVRVDARPGAKAARTRFRTVEVGRNRTLLEVELDTGRRHQIRVHLAWLGHPVVGDLRYGVAGRRMGLHAARLVVGHPYDGRELVIEAQEPEGFRRLMAE